MTLRTLEKSLLVAAEDDWVHFAELLFLVKEEAQRAEVATSTIDPVWVAEAFEREGLWCSGDVTASGFVAWNVSPEEAARRMREALRSMQRPVLMGDICWFQITTHGLETLKRHKEREPGDAAS